VHIRRRVYIVKSIKHIIYGGEQHSFREFWGTSLSLPPLDYAFYSGRVPNEAEKPELRTFFDI
jgi:hypothetical protein